MNKTKLKFEFLKIVQPLSKESLQKLINITNSDYFMLYNEFSKQDCHHTKSEQTKTKAKQDIDNFILKAYKNFRMLLSRGSYGKAKEYDGFLADQLYDIDSDVFKKSGYNAEILIRNLDRIHPEIKKKFGNFSPIYFQNDAFIHVNSNKFYVSKNKKQPNDCRLYLNLKIENVAEVAKLAMRYGQRNGLPLYFKFARNDDRNDTFLFYCSYEEAPQVIKLIETIKSEKPNLFDGAESVPPHLGVINGYIGFGEEPTEAKKLDIYEDGASYTEVRADALEELHILNTKIKKNNINNEQAKAMRSELLKKYDVASSNLLFLNQSTVDELERTGYSTEEIGKNSKNLVQMGD